MAGTPAQTTEAPPAPAATPAAEPPPACRPKLKADTVVLRGRTGAYLRNGQSAVVVKGPDAYRWLEALSPYLDGTRTLAQLCDGLPPQHRATVVELVTTMFDHGLAKDAGEPEPPGLLPVEVVERFRSQLEYIDHFVDEPRRRLAAFRSARVLLVGAGESLGAAGAALLRNGLAHLDATPTVAVDACRAALLAVAEEIRRDGTTATVRVEPTGLPVDEYDLVVYCNDDGGAAELLDLVRRCHATGPLLVPVTMADGRAVLGPIVRPGATPCWLCAQLRLATNGDQAVAAARWRDLAIGELTGTARRPAVTVARMIGTSAAFDAFRLLTGALPADTEGSIVLQDLQTLEHTREWVRPHPLCPLCRSGAADSAPVPTLADEPGDGADTDQERLRRCLPLVGAYAGVVTTFTDDALEQLPLKTGRVCWYEPAAATPDRRHETTAYALEDLAAARFAALCTAVRDYVGRLAVHPGARTATAAELVEAGEYPVPAEAVLTWTGRPVAAGVPTTWVPGVIAGSSRHCYLPAAAVWPLSAANAEAVVERTSAGAAVAPTVTGILTAGVSGACAYLALRDLLRGEGVAVPVADDAYRADERLAYLRRCASRLGATVRLYELPGAAPAHAALAIVDGADAPLWTVGSALSGPEALLAALRDAVGHVQVRHFEGRTADHGAPLLADFDPDTEVPVGDPAHSRLREAGAPWQRACADLRGRWQVAYVDTTTTDLHALGALRAGAVVLFRDGPDPSRGAHGSEGGDLT